LLQEHFVDNIRKLQSWKFKVDSEGKGQREEERGGSEYPEEKKQKKRSKANAIIMRGNSAHMDFSGTST